MKKLMKYGLALLVSALVAVSAFAQVYPVTNPTYVPNPTIPATTYTTTGTTTAFNINSATTIDVGITGTFTGLVVQVQVSSQRGVSPTDWQVIPVDSVDGDRYSQITATGLYRVNVAGFAQARLNITSLSTGSVGVSWSGGLGSAVAGGYNINKHTYHASVTGLVPAASATDILTIQGSASAIVKVTHFECSGQSTSGGSKLIQLQQRTTADTGGTSAVVPAVPSDASDPAATAVVTSYTANPTVGTATSGVARAGILNMPPAASAVGNTIVYWDFGAQSRTTTKEITLRGVTQLLALHGAGASFPSGAVLECAVEWVEE